jgi:two-component system, OmpR family, response regulator VanR
MAEAKIVVVDDEKEIADLITLYLTNEAYEVHTFYNGTDALAYMEAETPDLAVLDVMLPDMSGFSICQKIREKQNFPIIMVTAKDEEVDKITGLTLGADDYMTKPFRPLELIARVKAQLRRFTKYNNSPAQEEDPDSITISGLTINKRDHTCTLNEQPLALTPTEFSILWSLCKNRGQVVSSDRLFYDVWGEKYYSSNNNTIMVHIRHLREKMNDSSEKPKYIRTVWGVGYKIE